MQFSSKCALSTLEAEYSESERFINFYNTALESDMDLPDKRKPSPRDSIKERRWMQK